MEKILFLCGNNAARSQMAEGLAKRELAGRFEIYSAGVQPLAIHPMTREVMKEIEIDLSQQKSKPIKEVPWKEMNLIVTLCGASSNSLPPLPPTIKRLHWPVPDPMTMSSHYGHKKTPEAQKEAFKEVREMILKRINDFKLSLPPL
ncbi:MAG TPA: arsenate reductase ArsC [Candidatus Manganitrophaceae bacterium]|nr:arsenate reductase ArsC [Candidatus Manganitrophaceae bacterium]